MTLPILLILLCPAAAFALLARAWMDGRRSDDFPHVGIEELDDGVDRRKRDVSIKPVGGDAGKKQTKEKGNE